MSSSQGQHAVGMWDRDDALADSGHADGETTLGEHTATPQEPQSTQSKPQTIDNRGKSYCKFYGTKNGCRAGDACPFIHDPSKLQNNGPRPKARPKAAPIAGHGDPTTTAPPQGSRSSNVPSQTAGPSEPRRLAPPPVDGTRVVSRPVPKGQVENPREFQMQQIKRRFSPTEITENGGNTFTFQMVPSDPDFPFEMEGLKCMLHVPSTFAKEGGGKPRLEVTNEEMGREWQARVEKGFARLVAGTPGGTLLGLMRELDKQLERLLTEKEPEGITIIPNYIPGRTREQHGRLDASLGSTQASKAPLPDRSNLSKSPEHFTTEQRRLASQRRDAETKQLEARLGRTSLFSKSSDGIAYTIPITPKKHNDLPVPLQAVKSVKLLVPLLYPLQNCRVEILGVSRDAAKATELAFERKVKDSNEGTLMGHINYLAQKMHILAIDNIEDTQDREQEGQISLPPIQVGESATESKIDRVAESDRSHLTIIPRPPEWYSGDKVDASSDSESSDSYDSSDESSDDHIQGVPLPSVPEAIPVTNPERGVSLSFPFLDLHGIELLELFSLCITIKCERCKATMDINNLHDKAQKSESCKKCAMPLSIGLRKELMHANSIRAGYLDLDGCTVVDMLSSNFLPTCSTCSTTLSPPGLISVRGASTPSTCRACHARLTFTIPETKFLLISASSAKNLGAPVRKKPKESLGIVAGQELPRRGRCAHYSKSYRWFRFSCCEKVFACDRCHDEESDHANEHANRMICGWCSREQNYRPEDCAVCHGSLVKRAGSGFWEGGKGTRDKAKMSRKDPRKYKRRPGGAVRKN